MAQKFQLSDTIKNLNALLHGMREIEEAKLEDLSDLSNMSIDHIELLLASYCPGQFRQSAILLKRLFDECKEINSDKLVKSHNQRSQRFTLFPKLPPELRHCIWYQALPGPQVIELYHHNIIIGLDKIKVATSSQIRLVHLMKVCHEAKEVVKSSFRAVDARAFGIQTLPIGATILINYFRDVINLDGRGIFDNFLRSGHADTRLGAEALGNVQHLAVDSKEFSDFTSSHLTNSIGTLTRLKSLKKLFVVIGESRQSSMRRGRCRRNWQIRLCTPKSDHQHTIKTLKRKWSKALETSYGSEHVASVEIKFVTVHTTKDMRNTSVSVCPMIQDEIHRMVLLQQVQTPENIIQLPLM